jgi:hypothetical protein
LVTESKNNLYILDRMALKKKLGKSIFNILLLCTLFFIVLVTLYIALRGAFNYQKLEDCKEIPEKEFCGIKVINLSVPYTLNREILDQVESGIGKRVVIPGWKAGRTISTTAVKKSLPNLFKWYAGLENYISTIIGEKVYVTSDNLPTTCAVLVYEEDGDFINWHYDINYFNGRFFTLLIPVTITNTCTQYTYYNKYNIEESIKEEEGKSILFEGDKVFHMATKFCNKGKKRIMISVQFSTNPTISWYNNVLMRIKDTAYIGLGL